MPTESGIYGDPPPMVSGTSNDQPFMAPSGVYGNPPPKVGGKPPLHQRIDIFSEEEEGATGPGSLLVALNPLPTAQ